MAQPWPYPLRTTPAQPSTVRAVEAIKPAILQAMEDDGFPVEHYGFNFRVEDVTKPGYPFGGRAATMLRLVFQDAPHIPGELGPAKDAVYELILQRGIRDVGVEIVFLDKCFRPSLFAISRNDPAVQIYETARRSIREMIASRLRNEWSLLSLFKLGLVKQKSSPTIVVYVDPLSVHDWHDLGLQIKLKLPPNNPHAMAIDVEFLPGRIFTSDDDLVPGGHNMVDSMGTNGVPSPGTSITVLPETGGGTLGPFVVLRQNGKALNCALTNFHVVRPPRNTDEDIVKAADRFGSSPGNANKTAFDVSWLAPRDVEKTKSWVKENLDHDLPALRKEDDDIAMREIAGATVSKGLIARQASLADLVTRLQQQLAILERMPMRIGRTLLSSGRTIAENRLADWALIELDSELFANHPADFVNKFPLVTGENLPADTTLPPKEGDPLDQFGPLVKNSWYCKSGITTGVTGGICNGVSTDCQWPKEKRQRYSKDGKTAQYITDGITEEWVVTSEMAGAGGRRQTAFSLEGDSGSGIIDREGRICGLLYGGAKGLCGYSDNHISGLCSSMDDVRRWIEQRMGPGATLELPQ
ncbi:hypothetical protein BDW74DRAFT_174011 [Aspergillus multicolor]|uniref:uncharacterized protein n=1 Tax=Aspergillus multicolor TaxID=41759 RepID=UPI003CCC9FAE